MRSMGLRSRSPFFEPSEYSPQKRIVVVSLMGKKRVNSGPHVRQAILEGVTEMAKAVGVTYGPKGRTVMLDRPGGLLSTKDGVTVAWEVCPQNPIQKMGVQLLQKSCDQVNKAVGDGTTTTVVLTHAILKEAHKWVAAGASPALLSQDLLRVANLLEDADIFSTLCPIQVGGDILYQTARNASHGDEEVSQALVEAFEMVGAEGMISVEEGKGRGIELVHKNGLEIGRGLESSDFLPSGEVSLHMDSSLVCLVDGELHKLSDVQGILEHATQFVFPLVIISRGCFGEALQVIAMNNGKLTRADGQTLQVVACRVPGHEDQQRELLRDLASVTDAVILSPKLGDSLKECDGVFGSVQSCTLSMKSSVFVAFESRYELIENRVLELQRDRATASHSFDVEQINERIAKLTNGFCLMRVGAATLTEMRERRGRIEDALSAVRCAVDGGLVPGGGMSYLILGRFLGAALTFSEIMPNLSITGLGDRVLATALQAPFKLLAKNAGYDPEVVFNRVVEASKRTPSSQPFFSWKAGWDANTDTIRDFRPSGGPMLGDPMKVVKAVVLTSISTAAMLLSIETALVKP